RTPLDALPDLSDVQVIVYTNWEGQSPNLVEDQVTYPIVSSLISAPHVKTVRGYSFFGYSYVYVIFQDGTDLYWARSRVLEYLNGLKGQLPGGVNPNLGPDATGVGWGFEYVLVDKTGQHSLADLRTFQDWDLSYWLRAVPGVAEVSSVGESPSVRVPRQARPSISPMSPRFISGRRCGGASSTGTARERPSAASWSSERARTSSPWSRRRSRRSRTSPHPFLQAWSSRSLT